MASFTYCGLQTTVCREMPRLRFTVQDKGFRVEDSGFRVKGSGLRIQDEGFRVKSVGCRAWAILMAKRSPWWSEVVGLNPAPEIAKQTSTPKP